MKKMNLVLGAIVAMAAVTAPAQAQTITISSITPTWVNETPDNGVRNNSTNASDIRLCWPGTSYPTSADGGDYCSNSILTDNNADLSGYRFQRVGTPLNLDLSDGFELFKLGTFTHYNRPVSGTTLSSVTLQVALGISGASPSSYTESFLINHDETPNDPEDRFGRNLPCSYAGSTTRCDDYVSFGVGGGSSSFLFGGNTYSIDQVGFSQNGGTTVTAGFLSPENGTNSADLYARIRKTSVPEPSSVLLMASGLFGMVGFARRRNRNA